MRRERRRASREQEAARRRVDTPTPEPEELAWVQRQLDALPAADRRLFEERFDLGKTLREAGAVLGISAFAAHGRIRRVLGRLREMARERFS